MDLQPESVLKALEKGKLAPYYLFYGPDEFRLEKVLDRIRNDYIPESARDLNLEILYGDEGSPSEVVNHARSLPFLAPNRLIILRRTEKITASSLEHFLPYLEQPVETTCMIFTSSKTNFSTKFYKKFRTSGRAVHFVALKENQLVPWIKRMAKDLELQIDGQACTYLQQIVGNRLRDLHAELEKLRIRFGKNRVGIEEVKELVIHSRIYSIFELMDKVSERKPTASLDVLNRYLEEEDKRAAPLQIMGMLNRQIRLLFQTKAILDKGGGKKDVAKKLHLVPFSAGRFAMQSKKWSSAELENGLRLLYGADGLLKSGSRPRPVLENLVVSLCG
jgi:DNA polymerase-3 subunit delta